MKTKLAVLFVVIIMIGACAHMQMGNFDPVFFNAGFSYGEHHPEYVSEAVRACDSLLISEDEKVLKIEIKNDVSQLIASVKNKQFRQNLKYIIENSKIYIDLSGAGEVDIDAVKIAINNFRAGLLAAANAE